MTSRIVEQELRIPPEDFERIRSQSKMLGRSLDAAYEMLVEGKKLVAVANAYGLTKQRALTIRDKVYASFLTQTPQGWGVAKICAPEEMLERFIREAEAARLGYWQSRMGSDLASQKPQK